MAKRKKSDALPPRRSKRLKIRNGEVVEDSNIESPPVFESIEVEPKQPPLLALPAELRNRIYEYALQEPVKIKVTKSFAEPGLLSTNRQIRRETGAFYYAINDFNVVVVNCDARPLCSLISYMDAIGTYKPVSVRHLGKPNWANLLEWCRSVHEGRCTPMESPGLSKEELEDASQSRRLLNDTDVVAAVTKMSWKFPRDQWHVCEAALKTLRTTFGIANSQWLED